MIIERKKGSFHPLRFKIDLTKYGKTNEDIDDIIFSVKDKLVDADDSILLKKYSRAEIIMSGTTVIEASVTWLDTEYTTFVINKTYQAGIFIKFKGDPVADENINTTYQIKITQDYLRE